MGDRATVQLDATAHAIVSERLSTNKGQLRKLRHAIFEIVNGSANRPFSPQAKIKATLRGVPGLTFDQQEENFEEVVELTETARDGNVKAQSSRAIAKRALDIIEARRAASISSRGFTPIDLDEDDDEDDDDDSWEAAEED